MEDIRDLPTCEEPDTDKLLTLLKGRGVIPVTFIDWKKIDVYEMMMGLKLGKPREKLTKVLQMMFVLQKKH